MSREPQAPSAPAGDDQVVAEIRLVAPDRLFLATSAEYVGGGVIHATGNFRGTATVETRSFTPGAHRGAYSSVRWKERSE